MPDCFVKKRPCRYDRVAENRSDYGAARPPLLVLGRGTPDWVGPHAFRPTAHELNNRRLREQTGSEERLETKAESSNRQDGELAIQE